MRILSLGAAGEVGQVGAEIAAQDPLVSRIVLADRDLTRASALARAIGPKAVALRIDATDDAALDDAMRGCDLVMNAVGPFFRFGVPVLTAAIRNRRHYIDICDDPEPTLEMLGLDAAARAQGVRALIGMGASPGVSNLLAVRAGRLLDTVAEIVTGWNIDAAKSSPGDSGGAAIVHGMEQIRGDILVLRDGRIVREPALRGITVDYPGFETVRGWSFGHPEAVTAQRGFPGLIDSTNIVTGDRVTIAALRTLRWAMKARALSPGRAARLAAQLERLTPPDAVRLIGRGRAPPMFALAAGARDGRPARAAVALGQVPGFTMAVNAATPFAVMASLLTELVPVGVHTPETVLDPDRFFAAYAGHCIGRPHPDAVTVATCSWQEPAEIARALNGSVMTALMVA